MCIRDRDGTVFYPEGGGQPADRGTLTLPDGTVLRVQDVHEQAGILWQMCIRDRCHAVGTGLFAGNERFDFNAHLGEHALVLGADVPLRLVLVEVVGDVYKRQAHSVP